MELNDIRLAVLDYIDKNSELITTLDDIQGNLNLLQEDFSIYSAQIADALKSIDTNALNEIELVPQTNAIMGNESAVEEMINVITEDGSVINFTPQQVQNWVKNKQDDIINAMIGEANVSPDLILYLQEMNNFIDHVDTTDEIREIINDNNYMINLMDGYVITDPFEGSYSNVVISAIDTISDNNIELPASVVTKRLTDALSKDISTIESVADLKTIRDILQDAMENDNLNKYKIIIEAAYKSIEDRISELQDSAGFGL